MPSVRRMLDANSGMGTKRYFGPGFDLAKLAPAFATDGTMIAVAPFDAPAAHAATHRAGGSDVIGPQAPAAHASTHGDGGSDRITALGAVTAVALRVTPQTVGFAASITLNANTGNDFLIDVLTGNCTITWSNALSGNQGSVSVRQDATGGRTVTFTPPAGYTLRRDSAVADLAAAASPNAITVYTWAFFPIGGQNALIMSKMVLA